MRDKVQGKNDVWVCGMAMRRLVTDVLSTQSTSEPDVVNGISESIALLMLLFPQRLGQEKGGVREDVRRRRGRSRCRKL